jgi:hypothetical protein
MTISDSVPSHDTVAAELDCRPLAATAVRDGGTTPAVIPAEPESSTIDTATLLYSGTLRVLQFWDAPRSK